jgi:hypothetical protein
MDLLQTILNAQGGNAVQQLGQNVGLGQQETVAAISQLLPALAAGLTRNTARPGGLDGLLSALSSGSHQQYLDDPSRLSAPETIQDGNGILGHILGSKDVSRQIATQASAQTGIGADVLKRMLPLVATLAMGAMSKQTAAARTTGVPAAQSGLLSMLTPLLDSNRDGSIADDLFGKLGKFMS